MAVAYFGQGHSANGGVSETTAVCPVPASVPSGALMLMAVAISSNTVVVTPPIGWTEVPLSVNVVGTLCQLRIYERVSGGGEPGTYTVGFSALVRYSIGISVYTGAVRGQAVARADATAALSHFTPALTPATSGAWVTGFWATRVTTSAATWTPQAGDVERYEAFGNSSSSNEALSAEDSNGIVSGTETRQASTVLAQTTVQALLALELRPPDQTITARSIVDREVWGRPAVVLGRAPDQTVVVQSLLDREHWGQPTLLVPPVQTVVARSVVDRELWGKPSLVVGLAPDQTVSVRSVVDMEKWGQPRIIHSLVPEQSISPGPIVDREVWGKPRITEVPDQPITVRSILDHEKWGKPTVTTVAPPPPPVSGCIPLAPDLTCLPKDWGTDPALWTPGQKSAVEIAADLIWRLSAQQFGVCQVTLRPCRRKCQTDNWWLLMAGTMGVGSGGPWMFPLLYGGLVYNIPCGCGLGECGCGPICEVKLPGTVQAITEVKVDGQVVDPAEYFVYDHHRLVRTGTKCWPDCQDLGKKDTETGTWSVTYSRGRPLPPAGARALSKLATHLWRECQDKDCKLPARVSNVIREGVTFSQLDLLDYLKAGYVGVPEVDMWIRAVNPKGALARMGVYSPDTVGGRRQTWPGP